MQIKYVKFFILSPEMLCALPGINKGEDFVGSDIPVVLILRMHNTEEHVREGACHKYHGHSDFIAQL